MAKTIIQKCPECGKWCETHAKNPFEKIVDTMKEGVTIGGRYLGNVGELVGAGASVPLGFLKGIGSLIGNKYRFKCQCGAEWGTNDEKDDKRDLYDMEREVGELLGVFGETCQKGKSELEAYAHKVQSLLDDDRNSNVTRIYLRDILAATYSELDDKKNAMVSINESLKLSGECAHDFQEKLGGLENVFGSEGRMKIVNDIFLSSVSLLGDKENAVVTINESQKTFGVHPLSLAIKGYAMGEGRNSIDALAAMRLLMNYKRASVNGKYCLYTESQFHDRFVEIQNKYASGFLSMPADQRRFLYLIDGNLDDKLSSLPETIMLLPLLQLPTEMEMIGSPQDNVLYICHPYKANCYIPADEYQLELLRDELHEFCHIMECLGAKQISLSDSHTKRGDESRDKSTRIEGGVGYKGYSVGGGYEKQTRDSFDSMIQHELSERHEFLCPKDYSPYVPQDIVWYSHRQEWQRKVQSRLEGRLITDKYTIATSQSETISRSKKLAIEAEVKALGASLNLRYEGTSDFSISQSESYSQQVEVEFWPLKKIQTSKPQGSPKKKNWTIVALIAVIVILAVILGIVLL